MANFQSFANELTDLLEVERPKPATSDGENNDYRFERPVTFTHTGRKSRGRIDLYRRGCFILEAKQGGDKVKKGEKDQLALLTEKDAPKARLGHGPRGTAKWDDTMLKARNQADGYARAVSKEDGWPPFLMIVDVGHVIELYADFSRAGQGYNQFPDGNRYRIKLEDLRDDETRKLLQTIWKDPFSLDPSLKSAEVTRDIAAHLAELGKSFEAQGHDSEKVARFLMRCLFSMFAEDVELIPKNSFTELLRKLRGHPEHAAPSLKGLWETMNIGGFSQVLMQDLKRFNGGLFKEADALPLNNLQLGLLIEAAEADWKQVEPAIFGTLLERALDKRQRHKLGAHYTPRAYVQRLVTPTIMEPLRSDWKDVQTAVQRLMADGKENEARAAVHDFHRSLCEIRVLDPACGSGNFLYVAMEMMKRLEGEVTALLEELGEEQTALGLSGYTVDPHQFLGIELNPWAAAVAELVLWIGYLQWHFRTHGKASPSEPVLKDFKNIENRDAVLEWESRVPRVDETGNPVTRWDGITTMRHPVTGEEVPDPEARIQVYDYIKPKAAKWPEATFIVGNPPFIGASRLRENLGVGYVEALWKAYPKMPQSADLVMFWWDKAALAARGFDRKKVKGTRRFGLITTNSLRQTFNRRVLEPHLNDPKKPLSLLFAIPDHPWVDTLYGAAVRIAMTVGVAGRRSGHLLTVSIESKDQVEVEGRVVKFDPQIGKVFANLQIGADVVGASRMLSNEGLAHMGVKLHGMGFVVSRDEANSFGLGSVAEGPDHLRPFFNGRDLAQLPRGVYVIDFYGLSERQAKEKLPRAFQHVLNTVKPDRDAKAENSDDARQYAKEWWLFGKTRPDLRNAICGLKRMIATTRTAKHRIFQFIDCSVVAESKLVVVTLDGAENLAILNSRHHEVFSLAAGGWLGFGNDPTYNHSECFNKFPFPDLSKTEKTTLVSLGEELDAHRKRQQSAHPKLTLTQMYNVLEKLRAGETIEGKDKEIYDQGLIGILKDIHDRIDVAVADAYGWPIDLTDEEILFKLVELNKERAAEEAVGHIRWLRPDYQNPEGKKAEAKGKQTELDVGAAIKIEKAPWPKVLPEQIAAVREVLEELGEASPEQIARRFQRARTTAIEPLLASLAALGQAQVTEDGRYAA
ncbi:class I SAM-dependent DNA methyltransferase [Roseibium sediminis]|uniref:class I SAM-dependent DNA methyltransferase n=1 Tax=Roseibium sediminis TaxID=1775174 RepID=UPI00123D3782|nr:DNA methyltransferase [Roseibium sediminis]